MRIILALALAWPLGAAAAAKDDQAALMKKDSDTGGAVDVPEVKKPVDRWRADPTIRFDATEVELDSFKWIARPVVVLADTKDDPRFTQQMEYLASRPQELARRDVVVLVDTEPGEMSALRRRLRPHGFMLVLIGKDGQVKLRKPFPWHVREIGRSIDKMPMRQREINERRNLNQ